MTTDNEEQPVDDVAKPTVIRAEMRAFLPHRPRARHDFALPEHRIVYVKNPKAACSTVLLWLTGCTPATTTSALPMCRPTY